LLKNVYEPNKTYMYIIHIFLIHVVILGFVCKLVSFWQYFLFLMVVI